MGVSLDLQLFGRNVLDKLKLQPDQRITEVIISDPERNKNVCTRFYGNSPNSCLDISMNQKGRPQGDAGGKVIGSSKDIRIHPLGTINV